MVFVIQPTHFFLTLSVAYLSNLDEMERKQNSVAPRKHLCASQTSYYHALFNLWSIHEIFSPASIFSSSLPEH